MASAETVTLGGAGDPRSEDFVEQFGAFLLEKGGLGELAIRRAQRAQRQSGERFDVVLTRLGLLPDADLARLLAQFLGLPLLAAADVPEAPLFAGQAPAAFLAAVKMLPVSDDGERIVLAAADPFNAEAMDALSFLLDRRVEPAIMAQGDVASAIARLYGGGQSQPRTGAGYGAATEEQGGEEDVRRLEDMASEAPIIRLAQDLIARAVETGASDIHMEPGEEGLQIRLRMDGMLHTIDTLPPSARAAVISRIKIMAQLNIAERRLPQDGRIRATVRGRDIDLRVSTMPTMNGESVVMRILDRSSVQLDFTALGMSEGVHRGFTGLLAQPNGVILVTGPTGSGKTTTIYTALSQLNSPQRKTFTVEDPIEYQLAGVSQIQVQPKIGLTFASILRSILRQDPDTIMVGEIRDLETARVAVQASLTGHLVLSTVHANSAAATVARMLDMGVESYLLASALKGVLAQRLVRRLCSACAVPAEPSRVLMDAAAQAGLPAAPPDFVSAHRPRRPVGCPSCRQTGYRGRSMVSELLALSPAVQDAILNGGAEQSIRAAALGDGMSSMFHDGVHAVLRGETTLDEVLRVTRMD